MTDKTYCVFNSQLFFILKSSILVCQHYSHFQSKTNFNKRTYNFLPVFLMSIYLQIILLLNFCLSYYVRILMLHILFVTLFPYIIAIFCLCCVMSTC